MDYRSYGDRWTSGSGRSPLRRRTSASCCSMSRCSSFTALEPRLRSSQTPMLRSTKSVSSGRSWLQNLVRRGRVRVEGDRQVDRLRALDREGFLHGNVGQAFDHIRGVGNRAVHQDFGTTNDPAAQRAALEAVQTCFRLGVWFHRLLTGSREQRPFIPPAPPTGPADSLGLGEMAALRRDLDRAREALIEARLTFENKAGSVRG